MAKQDRSVRTRRRVLEAAAEVFDREGYRATTVNEIAAAAGMTKGAVYFHFSGKEELAQVILDEQQRGAEEALLPQAVKLQETADSGLVLAERLHTDGLVRASVRLSLDQQAGELDRSSPFRTWTEVNLAILQEAGRRGELLAHVDLAATAELFVGSFAGLQHMSQVLSGYADLPRRISVLLRTVLPSIAVPRSWASSTCAPSAAPTSSPRPRPGPPPQ
ncbi:ScbR family autoregulator-binding transcription factor [Streptomyces sp. AM 2-1-1]|uniref:ScbR family autoregulator-binding transcription factor n=1 Tax=Streptomyces sp. AM 2-1-1 TaxID=3028709 RepID=UPI0023B8F4E3|nr:ScbR family autoregulator-binding transcription factor [Streptomyces sp. AM 2-1-1]WEH43453.1 ScbR family autoregulator-binding transcription factor [Streptomyces sp. AM 2-1-1]